MLRIHPVTRAYLAVIASAVLACTIGGCGDKDRNPDPPPKPVGQNNVFGDMVASKDKASDGVNKAMDENQKKLDEAMRQQDMPQQDIEQEKPASEPQ